MEEPGGVSSLFCGGFLWEGYSMVKSGHEGTGSRVGLGYMT